MPAVRTIDEVILALTRIIQICSDEKSRLGYFPALYRRVTEGVKKGIRAGWFEDGARMERLDVAFANRYLEAWDDWRANRPVTASWRLAFEAGSRWRPVILQHLLSGMNAHINLDLAIAAAATSANEEIRSLNTDFNRINQLLAELIGPVEGELTEVSPWVRLIETFGGHEEGRVLGFGIDAARDLAWKNAVRLAPLQGDGRQLELASAIKEMDCEVGVLGRLIMRPGPLLQAGLVLVRAREENDAGKVIAALTAPTEGNRTN